MTGVEEAALAAPLLEGAAAAAPEVGMALAPMAMEGALGTGAELGFGSLLADGALGDIGATALAEGAAPIAEAAATQALDPLIPSLAESAADPLTAPWQKEILPGYDAAGNWTGKTVGTEMNPGSSIFQDAAGKSVIQNNNPMFDQVMGRLNSDGLSQMKTGMQGAQALMQKPGQQTNPGAMGGFHGSSMDAGGMNRPANSFQTFNPYKDKKPFMGSPMQSRFNGMGHGFGPIQQQMINKSLLG